MNNVINKDCTDEFLSNLRLKKIGIVFQSFNLISTMTAKENVLLPMIINDTLSQKKKEYDEKVLVLKFNQLHQFIDCVNLVQPYIITNPLDSRESE